MSLTENGRGISAAPTIVLTTQFIFVKVGNDSPSTIILQILSNLQNRAKRKATLHQMLRNIATSQPQHQEPNDSSYVSHLWSRNNQYFQTTYILMRWLLKEPSHQDICCFSLFLCHLFNSPFIINGLAQI